MGVARVVVPEGFSYDMTEMLAEDIRRALERLDPSPPGTRPTTRAWPHKDR
jgi:hypothetical protein